MEGKKERSYGRKLWKSRKEGRKDGRKDGSYGRKEVPKVMEVEERRKEGTRKEGTRKEGKEGRKEATRKGINEGRKEGRNGSKEVKEGRNGRLLASKEASEDKKDANRK